MVNLKKVDPTVRLRIYKERLETMPDKYKPKGLDKGNEACYSDNKINNMNNEIKHSCHKCGTHTFCQWCLVWLHDSQIDFKASKELGITVCKPCGRRHKYLKQYG